MTCPYCSSGRATTLAAKGRTTVYRCPECGGGFLQPQLEDRELKELYTETYYASWGLKDNDRGAKAMKIATFDRYLSLLSPYKSSGRILDVGCATGFFLEAAAARGFDPYGVEYSSYSAGIAAGVVGKEKVHNGQLEDCRFAEKSFDAITMFDLLEHVRNPAATLRSARRLLKDDGTLLIMTPDIDSLSAKVMGATWTHYKAEHFYYFNRRSMELTARSSGFLVAQSAGAAKVISLDYALTQFAAYPHRLITPLLRLASALIPGSLKRRHFSLHMGESLFILKKTDTPR